MVIQVLKNLADTALNVWPFNVRKWGPELCLDIIWLWRRPDLGSPRTRTCRTCGLSIRRRALLRAQTDLLSLYNLRGYTFLKLFKEEIQNIFY